MKPCFLVFAGVLLATVASADTVLFSFQAVQASASNDVVRARNFIEQIALNGTHKCLAEGLFARKYWLAAVNEMTAMLTSTNHSPEAVRAALSPDNLPHDHNSEVIMTILLDAHETLYAEFATQRRTAEVGRAFVESLRKGVNSALQLQTMLTDNPR